MLIQKSVELLIRGITVRMNTKVFLTLSVMALAAAKGWQEYIRKNKDPNEQSPPKIIDEN